MTRWMLLGLVAWLGCGDDAHSWAWDGKREKRWHNGSSTWGQRWKAGDVVGCAADFGGGGGTPGKPAKAGKLSYSLNGKWASPMGVAFEAVDAAALRPCLSFNHSFRCRVNTGERPFRHAPPAGKRCRMETLKLCEPEESRPGCSSIPLWSSIAL